MGYELKGKVKAIGSLMEYKNDFKKVDLVIETLGEYPQFIKCEAFKNIAEDLLMNATVGDSIEVLFDLKGNEYQGKYYTNVVVYKFEIDGKK